MTTPVVSPTSNIKDITHHVKLTDSLGYSVGLIVSNNGEPNELLMTRSPVDVTAMKISQGNPTYGDLEPPYYAIAQQDFSGGMGSDSFERNTTAILDSNRAHTLFPGKVHALPVEKLTSMAAADAYIKDWPPVGKTITWHALDEQLAIRLDVGSSINMHRACVVARRTSVGNAAAPLTAHRIVNAGDPGLAVSSDDALTGEILGEMARYEMRFLTLFVEDGVALPVAASGGDNWLVFDANPDYEIGLVAYGSSVVVTWSGSAWVLQNNLHAPHMIQAATYRQSMFFEYKGMVYLAHDDDKIYRLGDRGVADSNAGNLDKLIDASKTWVLNQWADAIVVLRTDTLREDQKWRRIISNTTTGTLVVDKDWSAANTGAEYIIIGTNNLTQIATGITGQILDIVVSDENVIYIMTTGGVFRMREYNNAGTWTVDAPAADVATRHPFGKQVGNRIWTGRNNVVQSSPVKEWGTNLVPGNQVKLGPDDGMLTGMESYIDDNGSPALWVFKENIAGFIKKGKFVPMDVREMTAARDDSNGQAHAVHDTYLYFNMGPRLQRYYEPQIDDLGPNNLLLERIGEISWMSGAPGMLLLGMNAAGYGLNSNDATYDGLIKYDTEKYSSILAWSNGGFHELYRAPNGARITHAIIQSVHGSEPGRLWFMLDGTVLGSIELPSYTTDITDDPELDRFSPEWTVTLAPISAGMKDLVKYCKKIKLYAEALDPGASVTNMYVDFLVEEANSKYWSEVGSAQIVKTGKAMYEIDLGTYGLSGKELTFRLRGKGVRMPVVYAVVVEVIARVNPKFAYRIPFVVEDKRVLLNNLTEDATAATILAKLDEWSGGGPLLLNCVNALYNSKTVILRPIEITAVQKNEVSKVYQFIGVAIAQDV